MKEYLNRSELLKDYKQENKAVKTKTESKSDLGPDMNLYGKRKQELEELAALKRH